MHKLVAKIRQVARVIGFLVAATSAVVLGKLHYRVLERAIFHALNQSHGNFDAMMPISEEMKQELLWCCSNAAVQNSGRRQNFNCSQMFPLLAGVAAALTSFLQVVVGLWRKLHYTLMLLNLKQFCLLCRHFGRKLRVNILKFFVTMLLLLRM